MDDVNNHGRGKDKFLRKHECAVRMVDTYLGGGQTKVLVNQETRRIIPRQGELLSIIEYYYKEWWLWGLAS
jgi:hypothetical protein